MEGDQLFGVSTDSWRQPNGDVVFTLVFEGGTGKFMYAEGEVNLTNVIKLNDGKLGNYINIAQRSVELLNHLKNYALGDQTAGDKQGERLYSAVCVLIIIESSE